MSHALDCCLHEATYVSGDADEVVAAAFSCQICLARAGFVLVSVGSAVAVALCDECGTETAVEMTGGQVVQLAVEPPAGLPVTFVW